MLTQDSTKSTRRAEDSEVDPPVAGTMFVCFCPFIRKSNYNDNNSDDDDDDDDDKSNLYSAV